MSLPDSNRRNALVPAPIPPDETERLAAVWQTALLDSLPSEVFNRITRSVAAALKVPIALISLVDQKRVWFLARCGIDFAEAPRDTSFCSRVVDTKQTMHVVDAWQDPRFAGSPLVTGEPHIRAYLGVPLFDDKGHVLGALCVLDRRAREFSAEERQTLARYAMAVQALLRR